MKGEARFSDDRRHRFELWRVREPTAPFALVVGLNPSIGAPDVDDPTLRRVQAFAQREGFVNVVVANAFSIRGTDPKILRLVADASNDENDRTLADLHARAGLSIAAWGDGARLYMRDLGLRRVLGHRPLTCLGYTNKGLPRHPLYVKGDTPLVPYPSTRSDHP